MLKKLNIIFNKINHTLDIHQPKNVSLELAIEFEPGRGQPGHDGLRRLLFGARPRGGPEDKGHQGGRALHRLRGAHHLLQRPHVHLSQELPYRRHQTRGHGRLSRVQVRADGRRLQ